MLKIVPGTKNKNPRLLKSAQNLTRPNMGQLNLIAIGRGFLPRSLLLSGLVLLSIMLFIVISLLAIMRRHPSSAYRVSYQEFVTDSSGVNSSTLFHMRPDGSYVRQFTPLEYGVIKGGANWSPDASEIVFMRITDISQPAVQRTTWHDLQTTSIIPTTRTDIPQPQWSPDGKYVALSLRGTLVIWDMQANRILYDEEPPAETWYHSPVWLPSSEGILFVARHVNEDTLLQLNMADGQIVAITENITEVANQRMLTPTVSPDGEWLAVHLSNPNFGNAHIVLIELDEKTVRYILDTPFGQFNPRWSPDGQWLIYNNGGFQVGQIGASVYRVNLVTDITQQLPQTVHSASGLVWSPDGRWLYYPVPEDNTWNIYRSDLNGGQAERLTNSPHVQLFPTVSPLIDKMWHGWLLGGLSLTIIIVVGVKLGRDWVKEDEF